MQIKFTINWQRIAVLLGLPCFGLACWNYALLFAKVSNNGWLITHCLAAVGLVGLVGSLWSAFQATTAPDHSCTLTSEAYADLLRRAVVEEVKARL